MQAKFITCLLAATANAVSDYSLFTNTNVDINPQPVIGIVSQPLATSMLSDPRFAKCDTYIMAAYVKFFESAGARVVPLIKGET